MNLFSRASRRTAAALLLSALPALFAVGAQAQSTGLSDLPAYKPDIKVVGGLRIAGSELKGNEDLLVDGFKTCHPDAAISTNLMASSEGALGMM